MKQKSIFKASFEESLNLEDDSFLQFQKKDYYNKTGKAFKKGRPTLAFHIQSIILSILFPIGLNFMLYVVSLMLYDTNPKDLTIPLSPIPLLTAEVYLICLLIWLLFVLIGKLFNKNYILPYRYRFHVNTFLIWFILEFNLLAIDVSLLTLSVYGILAIFVCISALTYMMISAQIKRLKNLIYNATSTSSIYDKVAHVIAVYGTGILGLGVIINIIRRGFSIQFSTTIEGLGLLLAWFILNIGIVGMLVFMEFPYFLEAYYKWRYPEEYREWEGKSLEDWYGKKYLKKHKELLRNE